jgi:hypothetical protein
MRRGLWLGVVWFGTTVALAGFVWILLAGRGFFPALFVAMLLFLGLTVYPLSFVLTKLPAGETPTGHGPWSRYEAAFLMFGFLVGATAVIVGVVLREFALAAAAGLALFGLLGGLPAYLLRRRRLGRPHETDERDELFHRE